MSPASISVVIPCFNASRFIAATIESVLSQEEDGLEIIVVDDGSSDGSARVVRAAYPSVRVIEQSNQGVAAARNRGIAEASNEWIAFVDADDVWLPGKLHAQRALLSAEPNTRMSYTAWHVWNSADVLPSVQLTKELERTKSDIQRWSGASGWIYPELLIDCVVWTSTVLIHRSVLDEVGLFQPELRVGEDYDLWLRASRVTPIVRVCAPLALYRMHPGSITRRAPAANYKGNVIRNAVQRWGYASPDGRMANRAAVGRSIARSWLDYGSACMLAGNSSEARVGALQALSHQTVQWSAWVLLARTILAGRERR